LAVLARQPADVTTHLEMAETAQGLGVARLAVWLLEWGLAQAPDSTALMRALARAYERGDQLGRAVDLWQKVQKADPADSEAERKINALSVRQYLAKGHFPPC
jgi:hypothetical protein